MDSTDIEAASFIDAVIDKVVASAGYLPGILAALLILVVGWFVARLARRAVRNVAVGANRLLDRAFPSGVFAGVRVSSVGVTLLGELVFWAVALVAVTMAARVAELTAISDWLDRITAHLPNLLAGITIVVIGYFLSVYVREELTPQTPGEADGRGPRISRIAQGGVIAIALIVALDQVGIDVALLVGLTIVCAAAVLLSLAGAFALGARNHVSNLVGARTARHHLSVGMRLRVGEVEGEILDISASQITLDTEHGQTLVPARLVDEVVICVVTPEVEAEPRDA